MFLKPDAEAPPKPHPPCARCGGVSCWTIWGHRTCESCSKAWDALNIDSDFQKRTDAWVKAGAKGAP